MRNGKVRFGVVGTNFITDWVIAGARQDERFELAAVYSRTQERADEFAAKHQIPHTFTSLEAMAESPLIDAVYIASPNFLHAEQSILCMSRGKHVLCEKPFASNAKEVRAMIEASERYGVTLMEAMKPTLTPNFKAARAALNRLGTIRRYFSCYCQYSSRYDKFKEGIVLNAFRPELSNGAMMDIRGGQPHARPDQHHPAGDLHATTGTRHGTRSRSGTGRLERTDTQRRVLLRDSGIYRPDRGRQKAIGNQQPRQFPYHNRDHR